MSKKLCAECGAANSPMATRCSGCGALLVNKVQAAKSATDESVQKNSPENIPQSQMVINGALKFTFVFGAILLAYLAYKGAPTWLWIGAIFGILAGGGAIISQSMQDEANRKIVDGDK